MTHIDLLTSDLIPAHQASADRELRAALLEHSPVMGRTNALVRFAHGLHVGQALGAEALSMAHMMDTYNARKCA